MSLNIIEKMMSEKVRTVTGIVSMKYFTEEDVKDMLCRVEAIGYGRAEMDIFNGVCNICGGSGQIDIWDTCLNKKVDPPYDKMCCWKCCGDGKLPAKCDREKL